MFGRRKGGKGSDANKLRNEAEPNTLSWGAADASAEDDAFEAGESEAEELDDDEVDASFGEDEEEDSEDEVELARRQVDLRAELERQAEEFGLANQDAASIYGENGDAVVEVLDQLDRMDLDTAEQLADAWTARDPAERDIVEREMRRTHRGGRHSYELSAAGDSVSAWLARRLSAEPDDADLWRIVAEAARAAVEALILDQDLDDVDYDALYGAWDEVVGEGAAEAEEGAVDSDEADAAEEQIYGPNTALVTEFLARLGELSGDQARDLAAAWKRQPRGDLRQAHDAVQKLAAEDETWRNQVLAAQKATTAWPKELPLGVDPASRRGAVIVETLTSALPPAVDAVTALVLADLLETEDAETLYRPWTEAIGEPGLPEFEEDGAE